MKKILIPTDFSVQSLQLVDYALLNFPNTKLDIVLMAGYKLPDSRWAITHFSESEVISKQSSQNFRDENCRLLVEHRNVIESLSFELFTGVNSLAFQNVLDKLDIDCAVIPKEGAFNFSSNKWFDVTKYIEKNISNIIKVPVELKNKVVQKKYSLLSLFN